MTTRGEQMLALRKARMAAAPPILRGGFRPFFFLAAAWAAAALLVWLSVFLGGAALPSGFSGIAWHRHEMLFGFTGAAIVGFLLTAIPNWTGRLPIAGAPLALLAALWLAARAAVWFSGTVGLILAAVLDVGFFLTFAAVAGREVVAAKNRNVPAVALVLLFGCINAWDYAAAAGLTGDEAAPTRAAISVVIVLVSLIGGRIVPSFTRNWMAKRRVAGALPEQPGRFDTAIIVVTALALASWAATPAEGWIAPLLIVAGIGQIVRLSRWRGWRTWSDPLVVVLHVAYAWIPVGLLLLGASAVGGALPASAGVHALTAGAVGTMILAVMTRASLGHTGRELRAGPATVALYACVSLGAAVRVVTGVGVIDYRLGVEFSGALWTLAFALFALAYAPVLFGAAKTK